MTYPSINIQGNIISSEILDKIRQEDIKYQQASDFGLDRKTSLRDEIGVAWAAARAHYMAFRMRVDRLKEGDSGASETRNSWILPLLRELGYDTEKAPAFIHPDTQKSYAISHHVPGLSNFPIHIMGVNDDLDKRRENGGPKLSPHALIQEYLNNTEHVYALVSNGRFLRLLRDATRLVRLSYLEFDLEKMMEEELYSDFAILFRLMHATRMPRSADQTQESHIEYYHQESLASGSRIREKLSEAVEKSIKQLANGFLKHRENLELRQSILTDIQKPGKASDRASEYYSNQLRLIYRLLFLIVTEERNLVYPETRDPETQRLRKIYYDYYSIEKLRRLASRGIYVDGAKQDLWEGLKTTFELFERTQIGSRLGIHALGSGIFSPTALGELPLQKLNNDVLLGVIRNLTMFENDQRQWVRVNYGDLDVEEFGSVYEGLLEFDAAFHLVDGIPLFTFVEGKGRSESGAHYTPEELVKPLIKHSLDYLIADKLKESDPEKGLLSLTICDVACGSGHILLSAARRIAIELARVRSGEDQPSPTVLRHALRDVIKTCIYGVDKNPLAVELCKVALWLESHNPGEPLGFLDHHIKCGDAIVGLAHQDELKNGIPNEAFKTLNGDDKLVASSFITRNKQERKVNEGNGQQLQTNLNPETLSMVQEAMEQYGDFMRMPERNPEEVAAKQQAYNRVISGRGQSWLKAMADTQVAQFFIPKTGANKDNLMTDADYRLIISGYKGWQNSKVAKATAVALEQRFFHWFIEFPEVFSGASTEQGRSGGFDCVLGNPPFLGDKKQKKAFGDNFLEYIRASYAVGINDLVVYFFNRIYSLIDAGKYQALITTSSISQGDMRAGALDNIQKNNGNIIYAIKSIRWPGVANLNVALVVIKKGKVEREIIELNGENVNYISNFLTSEVQQGEPFDIKVNENKMFTGYYFLGDGFLLTNERAKEIIDTDPKYKDVILPFINGDDLNDSFDQSPSRSIINFYDWPLDETYDFELKVPRGRPYATEYPICLDIVKSLVKPERQRWKVDKNGNEVVGEYALRKPLPERWWIYGENRPGMRNATKNLSYFFATAQTTKYLNFVRLDSSIAVSQTAFVFSSEEFSHFLILQSTLHYEWSVKYGNSKGDTFRYAPSKTFETFPFPQILNTQQKQQLESIGESHHEHRRQLMLGMQLGLTKTYNLFHSNVITAQAVNENDKQVAALHKHLENTPNTISFNEAIQGILKLRELHVQMDDAVLDAYGWNDIALRHGFYEVDYLPENDRIRWTIYPDAKREILKRLLDLNHKIYREEIWQGEHKYEDVVAFYVHMGEPIPIEVQELYTKKKSKPYKEKKPKTGNISEQNITYDLQHSLFGNEQNQMKEFSLHDGIYSVQEASAITGLDAQKVARWFKELQNENYEGLNSSKDAKRELRLSFHGLIEIVVIGTLRENGFTLRSILKARKDLGDKTGKLYPFATNNVRDDLHVAGSDIVFKFPTGFVTLNGTGQYNLEIIKTFFKDVVFDTSGVAQRLVPKKGKGYIIIDPKVGGGKPSIVDKGVWADMITSLYQGPESLSMIEAEYDLSKEEVQAALEYYA